MNDAIEQFRAAMESHGVGAPPEIKGDGKLHRFDGPEDKRGRESSWYVLHLDDRPAGSFGSWRTGVSETWTARVEKKLTAQERKELERTIAIQRKQREEEEARVQAEAAKRAEEIWAESEPATEHAYLTRKGVRANGTRQSRGSLVIPMRDQAGKIWSLQFINPTGEKKYLSGGRKRGSYFTIGRPAPGAPLTLLVCEGFATGASLHSATDLPVAVAFDSGNLEPVARALRKKYADARIIICADNDQWKPPKNPGVEAGAAAAEAVGGVMSFPAFQNMEAAKHEGWTDFNDLAASEGLERIAENLSWALTSHLPPVVVPPEPIPEPITTRDPVPVEPERRGFFHIIHDWPLIGGNRKPIACIENVKHLLDENRISVRYDVIRKDLSITIPGESYLIDTEKNDKLTRIVSLAATAGLSADRIESFVAHIGSQNPINPVGDWITSQPWDGQTRLPDFYETVEAVGDEDPARRAFKETILRRWMLSAVAAAFRPEGVSAHGVLVFTGEQYIGKTNWFKRLVPVELKVTRDGMLLDPKDKDSVYQIVSNWIVELGELDATFRKADIAQLKAFVTKDKDTIRLPYERFPASFARRTVFFASVNDRDYLADPTGNRRFWTIECKTLHHQHGLNMQQIWAEFLELFRNGESWYLTSEEMAQLNVHNRDFEVSNPMEELIRSYYDWEAVKLWPTQQRQLTPSEIAQEIGFKTPGRRDQRDVGAAMRVITGQQPEKLAGGRRVFRIPSLRAEYRNSH